MQKIVFASLAGLAAGQDVFLPRLSTSKSDVMRAKLRTQPGRLAGSTPTEIASKLNAHIQKSGGASKACDTHNLTELNAIVRNMHSDAAVELDQIYKANEDSRSKRFATLEEYEAAWAGEEDNETTRHAKCFEIAEMWAHHLPEAAKNRHVQAVPRVPVFDKMKTDKLYVQSASCQTGHAMVAGGDGSSTHQWPDWPEELHYTAKGHGAYPFWWGGGSDSGTSDMEVWWSEKQGAEKFYHSSCTGQSSWLNGACYHLMIAPQASSDYKGYLYTADESKCCISQPTSSGGREQLAPSQGTFWKTFSYQGEVDFNGVHYQGKVKYYLLQNVPEPVNDFWYFTDLDGKPVQQGEAGTGPTDQGYPESRGHTIWHDYDQSSFDTSAIDSSVFAIPAVCKSTSLTCEFP